MHTFICNKCGVGIQDDNTRGVHKCPKCGEDMRWDIGKNASGRGDYHHTSDSLAIHPDDIPEHHKLYPDVEVTSEGQPQFTSARQQEKYAEKSAGCYKKRQRTHTLGRQRIA